MRVLLAGASGAIGTYLVPQLLAAHHQVIGVTRTPGSLADTGAREVVADLSDRAGFLEAIGKLRVDAVVHQATALSKPPRSYGSMRDTNRLRTEGTSTLIAAARRAGAKKFVAASFFGGYGYRNLGRNAVDESAPFGEPDGRNDTVLTALLSLEQQVRAFGGVALRYGLFYAPGSGEISPVARHWSGKLPMVHLSDAASAVVAALAKGKPGEAYNIADDNPVSYRERELARASAVGAKAPLELPEWLISAVAPYGSQLLTHTSMVLSTEKARHELGWKPEHPSITEWAAAARPPVPAGE